MDIRPFDVIMTQLKDKPDEIEEIVSEIITWLTGGPSHVRVYCKGLHEDFDFWEVTYPHCRFGYMKEIDYKSYEVEIGRHKELPFPLPQDLCDKGIAAMLKLEGTDYDLGELFFSQLFDLIGIDHTDQSDPNKFVCSSGAEHIFITMGYPFCPGDLLVSPEDIVKSLYYEKALNLVYAMRVQNLSFA